MVDQGKTRSRKKYIIDASASSYIINIQNVENMDKRNL